MLASGFAKYNSPNNRSPKKQMKNNDKKAKELESNLIQTINRLNIEIKKLKTQPLRK